jgi:predicted regulator of Ras-like GTPase activity (Roadblock/LC7/MglB family)
MDPAQALSELTEISSQIEAACLLGSDGSVLANTITDEVAAKRFADTATALAAEALRVPRAAGDAPLAQLEAATPDGSVFVVIEGDRAVAAVTKPEPTVGLVFYDLKSCLRAAGTPGDGDGKPRPKARKIDTEKGAASESAA